MAGCGSVGPKVGQPELPFRGFHLEIPHGIDLDVQLGKVELEYLGSGYVIKPMQPDVMERDDEPAMVVDEEAYATDALLPATPLSVGPAMVARGRRLVHIQVWVAQYNPVTTELWVVKSLELKVSMTGTPDPEREQRRDLLQSDNFDRIFKPFVLNLGDFDLTNGDPFSAGGEGESTGANEAEREDSVDSADRIAASAQDDLSGEPEATRPTSIPSTPKSKRVASKSLDYADNGENFLIIASDGTDGGENLASRNLRATTDFIEWKKRQGYYVKQVTTSQIGSSLTAEDIKDFIQRCYDGIGSAGYPSGHPPTYVLLIGDNDQIPPMEYKQGHALAGEGECDSGAVETPFPNDTLYACVDGDDVSESCWGDFFPDLVIARIPAERQDECTVALTNIMRYEIDPVGNDSSNPYAWLESCLSACKLEDDNDYCVKYNNATDCGNNDGAWQERCFGPDAATEALCTSLGGIWGACVDPKEAIDPQIIMQCTGVGNLLKGDQEQDKAFLESSVFSKYWLEGQNWTVYTAWHRPDPPAATWCPRNVPTNHLNYFRDILISEGFIEGEYLDIKAVVQNDIHDVESVSRTEVQNALNTQGVGLVVYRDHGRESGWKKLLARQDLFDTTRPYYVDNASCTPVVLSMCCLTGNFSYEDGGIKLNCFAEAWLERSKGDGTAACSSPTGGAVGGAVGVVAATALSGVGGIGDLMAHGLFTSFWPCYDTDYSGTQCDGASGVNDGSYAYTRRMGEALLFAKYYMSHWKGMTEEGDYRGGVVKNYICYHYFGDPSIELRVAAPGTLAFDYPEHVVASADDVARLTVTVTDSGTNQPVEGARVCLSSTLSESAWAITDANGEATVSLNLSGLNVNSRPDTRDINVVATAEGYVAFGAGFNGTSPTYGEEVEVTFVPSPRIVIEDDGILLALIDDEGNIDLKGTTYTGGSISVTTPSFCIKSSGGTVEAKIDANGNLYCQYMYENRSILQPPTSGCWVVVDANDDEQLFVDSFGQLYTRGSVNTNAI